jgi:hypothetical protein
LVEIYQSDPSRFFAGEECFYQGATMFFARNLERWREFYLSPEYKVKGQDRTYRERWAIMRFYIADREAAWREAQPADPRDEAIWRGLDWKAYRRLVKIVKALSAKSTIDHVGPVLEKHFGTIASLARSISDDRAVLRQTLDEISGVDASLKQKVNSRSINLHVTHVITNTVFPIYFLDMHSFWLP